ncbi:MAG: phosphatase PAP2 family protein [Bacteroidales bacterium]|nr:phosphatase PAP2 family protein [Bacteroidales bacterium]
MARKVILCVLMCLCLCGGARAQYARDTLDRQSFRPAQLIAPALLAGAGLSIHFLGHDAVEVPIRTFVQDNVRKGVPASEVTGYVRWVPGAMHLSLGLLGVPSRHAFVDRSIEDVISFGFCLGGGYLLKKAFHGERPGGGEFDSFPSGHCMIAFTGAELMRMDYGWAWGGGAYALAAVIGGERLLVDRHWLGDVLAGAGFGILSAHVGGWLLDPVKSLFGIPDVGWDGLSGRRTAVAFHASADPLSGTPLAGVSVSF